MNVFAYLYSVEVELFCLFASSIEEDDLMCMKFISRFEELYGFQLVFIAWVNIFRKDSTESVLWVCRVWKVV